MIESEIFSIINECFKKNLIYGRPTTIQQASDKARADLQAATAELAKLDAKSAGSNTLADSLIEQGVKAKADAKK